jgi:hypothetical protein
LEILKEFFGHGGCLSSAVGSKLEYSPDRVLACCEGYVLGVQDSAWRSTELFREFGWKEVEKKVNSDAVFWN